MAGPEGAPGGGAQNARSNFHLWEQADGVEGGAKLRAMLEAAGFEQPVVLRTPAPLPVLTGEEAADYVLSMSPATVDFVRALPSEDAARLRAEMASRAAIELAKHGFVGLDAVVLVAKRAAPQGAA